MQLDCLASRVSWNKHPKKDRSVPLFIPGPLWEGPLFAERPRAIDAKTNAQSETRFRYQSQRCTSGRESFRLQFKIGLSPGKWNGKSPKLSMAESRFSLVKRKYATQLLIIALIFQRYINTKYTVFLNVLLL